jgi:hypothetical protein
MALKTKAIAPSNKGSQKVKGRLAGRCSGALMPAPRTEVEFAAVPASAELAVVVSKLIPMIL